MAEYIFRWNQYAVERDRNYGIFGKSNVRFISMLAGTKTISCRCTLVTGDTTMLSTPVKAIDIDGHLVSRSFGITSGIFSEILATR